MTDPRYATVEEVAVVRERVARVEGVQDNLRDDMKHQNALLMQAVNDNAAETRREMNDRFSALQEKQDNRDNDLSSRLGRIEEREAARDKRMMFWAVLITGLLGWGQIGDAAWRALCHIWHGVFG